MITLRNIACPRHIVDVVNSAGYVEDVTQAIDIVPESDCVVDVGSVLYSDRDKIRQARKTVEDGVVVIRGDDIVRSLCLSQACTANNYF